MADIWSKIKQTAETAVNTAAESAKNAASSVVSSAKTAANTAANVAKTTPAKTTKSTSTSFTPKKVTTTKDKFAGNYKENASKVTTPRTNWYDDTPSSGGAMDDWLDNTDTGSAVKEGLSRITEAVKSNLSSFAERAKPTYRSIVERSKPASKSNGLVDTSDLTNRSTSFSSELDQKEADAKAEEERRRHITTADPYDRSNLAYNEEAWQDLILRKDRQYDDLTEWFSDLEKPIDYVEDTFDKITTSVNGQRQFSSYIDPEERQKNIDILANMIKDADIVIDNWDDKWKWTKDGSGYYDYEAVVDFRNQLYDFYEDFINYERFCNPFDEVARADERDQELAEADKVVADAKEALDAANAEFKKNTWIIDEASYNEAHKPVDAAQKAYDEAKKKYDDLKIQNEADAQLEAEANRQKAIERKYLNTYTMNDWVNARDHLLEGAKSDTPNLGEGNIDLNSRPIYVNDDGSYSTVDSVTFEENGEFVVVPTICKVDGKWQHLDGDEAWDYYKESGEYLGKFDTKAEADAYAEKLHKEQEEQYSLAADELAYINNQIYNLEYGFMPAADLTRAIQDLNNRVELHREGGYNGGNIDRDAMLGSMDGAELDGAFDNYIYYKNGIFYVIPAMVYDEDGWGYVDAKRAAEVFDVTNKFFGRYKTKEEAEEAAKEMESGIEWDRRINNYWQNAVSKTQKEIDDKQQELNEGLSYGKFDSFNDPEAVKLQEEIDALTEYLEVARGNAKATEVEKYEATHEEKTRLAVAKAWQAANASAVAEARILPALKVNNTGSGLESEIANAKAEVERAEREYDRAFKEFLEEWGPYNETGAKVEFSRLHPEYREAIDDAKKEWEQLKDLRGIAMPIGPEDDNGNATYVTDIARDPEYNQKVESGMEATNDIMNAVLNIIDKQTSLQKTDLETRLFGGSHKTIDMNDGQGAAVFQVMNVAQNALAKIPGLTQGDQQDFLDTLAKYGLDITVSLPSTDWSTQELQTFAYYLGNGDVDIALEYAHDQNVKYAGLSKAERTQMIQDFANKMADKAVNDESVGGRIIGNLWTAGMAVAQGLPTATGTSLVESLATYSWMLATGEAPVTYTPTITEMAEATTQGISLLLNEKWMKEDILGTGVDFGLGSIYNAVASTITSLETLAVGGWVTSNVMEMFSPEVISLLGGEEKAVGVLQSLYTDLTFAGSAMTSGAMEAYERTGNIDQAMKIGLVNAVCEGLFETLSLEMLVDGLAELNPSAWIWKSLAIQGLTEGSEEMFTDVGNWIGDWFASADMSEFEKLYRDLQSDEFGLTPEEAEREVKRQMNAQILEDGIVGALSGAGSAGIRTVKTRGSLMSAGAKIFNNDMAESLVDAVLATENTVGMATDAQLDGDIAKPVVSETTEDIKASEERKAAAHAEEQRRREEMTRAQDEAAKREAEYNKAVADRKATEAAEAKATEEQKAAAHSEEQRFREEMEKAKEAARVAEEEHNKAVADLRAAEKASESTEEAEVAEEEATEETEEAPEKSQAEIAQEALETEAGQQLDEILSQEEVTKEDARRIIRDPGLRRAFMGVTGTKLQGSSTRQTGEILKAAKEYLSTIRPAIQQSMEEHRKRSQAAEAQAEEVSAQEADLTPEEIVPAEEIVDPIDEQKAALLKLARGVKEELTKRGKAVAEEAIRIGRKLAELQAKVDAGVATKAELEQIDALTQLQESNTMDSWGLTTKLGRILSEFRELNPAAYNAYVMDNFHKFAQLFSGDAILAFDEKYAQLRRDASEMARLQAQEQNPGAIILTDVGSELQKVYGLKAEVAEEIQGILNAIVNYPERINLPAIYKFANSSVMQSDKTKVAVAGYINGLIARGIINLPSAASALVNGKELSADAAVKNVMASIQALPKSVQNAIDFFAGLSEQKAEADEREGQADYTPKQTVDEKDNFGDVLAQIWAYTALVHEKAARAEKRGRQFAKDNEKKWVDLHRPAPQGIPPKTLIVGNEADAVEQTLNERAQNVGMGAFTLPPKPQTQGAVPTAVNGAAAQNISAGGRVAAGGTATQGRTPTPIPANGTVQNNTTAGQVASGGTQASAPQGTAQQGVAAQSASGQQVGEVEGPAASETATEETTTPVVTVEEFQAGLPDSVKAVLDKAIHIGKRIYNVFSYYQKRKSEAPNTTLDTAGQEFQEIVNGATPEEAITTVADRNGTETTMEERMAAEAAPANAAVDNNGVAHTHDGEDAYRHGPNEPWITRSEFVQREMGRGVSEKEANDSFDQIMRAYGNNSVFDTGGEVRYTNGAVSQEETTSEQTQDTSSTTSNTQTETETREGVRHLFKQPEALNSPTALEAQVKADEAAIKANNEKIGANRQAWNDLEAQLQKAYAKDDRKAVDKIWAQRDALDKEFAALMAQNEAIRKKGKSAANDYNILNSRRKANGSRSVRSGSQGNNDIRSQGRPGEISQEGNRSGSDNQGADGTRTSFAVSAQQVFQLRNGSVIFDPTRDRNKRLTRVERNFLKFAQSMGVGRVVITSAEVMYAPDGTPINGWYGRVRGEKVIVWNATADLRDAYHEVMHSMLDSLAPGERRAFMKGALEHAFNFNADLYKAVFEWQTDLYSRFYNVSGQALTDIVMEELLCDIYAGIDRMGMMTADHTSLLYDSTGKWMLPAMQKRVQDIINTLRIADIANGTSKAGYVKTINDGINRYKAPAQRYLPLSFMQIDNAFGVKSKRTQPFTPRTAAGQAQNTLEGRLSLDNGRVYANQTSLLKDSIEVPNAEDGTPEVFDISASPKFDGKYSIASEFIPAEKETITIQASKTVKKVNMGKHGPELQTVRDVRNEAFKNNPVFMDLFGESGIETINAFIDQIADYLKEAEGRFEYLDFADINNATLQYDPVNGTINLSSLINNGEYRLNVDFGTICERRQALQTIVDKLLDTATYDENGIASVDLNPTTLFQINEILRDEGINTQCLICFVETKRLTGQNQYGEFATMWNTAVHKKLMGLGRDAEFFNFKGGETFSEEVLKNRKRALDGIKMSGKGLDVPKLIDDVVERLAKDSPEDLKLLNTGDIMSSEGRTNMVLNFPILDAIIKKKGGTAAPKAVYSYIPYNGEIEGLKPGWKGTSKLTYEEQLDALQAYVRKLAGVRSQSFSDFIITHVFDHIQKTGGLSAMGLTAHTYTKVPARAELFGLTGEKINMSLLFGINENLSPWFAGLTKEINENDFDFSDPGNRVYNFSDYAAHQEDPSKWVQSFPWAKAIELQNKEGYSKNVGTIGVALSYWHYKMMLADPEIRQIIGYHKSSLPGEFGKAAGLKNATDYTGVQNVLKFEGFSQLDTRNPFGVPSYATPPVGFKQKKTAVADNPYADLKKVFQQRLKAPENKGLSKGEVAHKLMQEILDYAETNNYTLETTKAKNGHGDFDLYGNVDRTRDPKKTGDNFIAYCFENGWLPSFFEFSTDENYYKQVFDFNMYDKLTGEYAPQEAVHMLDENRELAFPANFMELLDDYTTEYNGQQEKTQAFLSNEENMEKIRGITERYSVAYDSTGDKLSRQQIEYFKNSKIRNEYGELLKLYHGTPHYGFTVMDPSKLDDNLSFFMTDSVEVAETYSDSIIVRSLFDEVQMLSPQDLARAYNELSSNAAGGYVTTYLSPSDISDQITDMQKMYRVYADKLKKDVHDAYDADESVNNIVAGLDQLLTEDLTLENGRRKHEHIYNILYSLPHVGNLAYAAQEVDYAAIQADELRHCLYRGNNGEDGIFETRNASGKLVSYDTIDEIRDDYAQSISSEAIYPLYANITDPFVLEAENQKWRRLKVPQKVADYLKTLPNATRFYGINLDAGITNTRGVAKYAKDHGYDGAFIKGAIDMGGLGYTDEDIPSNIVIAFDSNQIKDAKNLNPTSNPDFRYSVVANVEDINGDTYDRALKLDYPSTDEIFTDNTQFKAFVDSLDGEMITVFNDGMPEIVTLAGTDERVRKDGSKNKHPARGDLYYAHGRNKRLIILNAVDAAAVSEASRNTENKHGWLDENGWDNRTLYVISNDNVIFPAVLHIAHARDGRALFYDVSTFKDKGVPVRSMGEEITPPRIQTGTPFTSIAQTGTESNLQNFGGRNSIATDEKAQKAIAYNNSKTETGDKLKTLNGSDISRGGSLQGIRYDVGKVIGGRIYIHNDYLDTIAAKNPAFADAYDKAVSLLRSKYPDFEYSCISYSPKENNILFQEAPGFDAEREPVVGNMVKVDLNNDTVGPMRYAKQIWHHKWQWVDNDYPGFDVRKSWEWSREWLNNVQGESKGGSLEAWNKQLDEYGLPHDTTPTGHFSLAPVQPIQPSSDKWSRTYTEDEAKEVFPKLWTEDSKTKEENEKEFQKALGAAEKEAGHKFNEAEKAAFKTEYEKNRHPTQVKGTVSTYKNIYDLIRADNPDAKEKGVRILDASSGLGYGTRLGRGETITIGEGPKQRVYSGADYGKANGFYVDDIEPYPAPNYNPSLGIDYSALGKEYDNYFDAIISSAVLNVTPQDRRDELIVKMGQMLKPGGKLYVTVRADNVVDTDLGGPGKDNVKLDYAEYIVKKSGAYQKGFSKAEFKAYLEDALGPGYTVEPTTKFAGTSMIVTKDADYDTSKPAKWSYTSDGYTPEKYEQLSLFDLADESAVDQYGDPLGTMPQPESVTPSDLSDRVFYSIDTAYIQTEDGQTVVIENIGEDSPEAQYINYLEAMRNAERSAAQPYSIPANTRNGDNGYSYSEQSTGLRRGQAEVLEEYQEEPYGRTRGIPERNGQSGSQAQEQESVRYSLTPTDRTYFTALDNNDTEAARKLVENAAKKAGYKKIAYHGTLNAGFNQFWEVSRNELGVHFGTREAADVFRQGKGTGKTGNKPGVYEVYLRMKNTLKTPDVWGDYFSLRDLVNELDGMIEDGYIGKIPNPRWTKADSRKLKSLLVNNADYREYLRACDRADRLYDDYSDNYGLDGTEAREEAFYAASREANQAARQYLRNLGYDSVRYVNEVEDKGKESYIILDPENIKSADTVTYDDAGEIIPLSERFNDETRDIRYSIAFSSFETEPGGYPITSIYNSKGEVIASTDMFPLGDFRREVVKAVKENNISKLEKIIQDKFKKGTTIDQQTQDDVARMIDENDRLSEPIKEAMRKKLDELITKYGEKPHAKYADEHPERVLPDAKSDKTKTRKHTQTEMRNTDSGAFADLLAFKALTKAAMSYVPISNKETIEKARQIFMSYGANAAVKVGQHIEGLLLSHAMPSATDIALGEIAVKELVAEGKYNEASKIVADLSIIGTKLGQATQAMNILRSLTPMGRLYYMQRVVNELNHQYEGRIKDPKDKMNEIYIPVDIRDRLLGAKSLEDLDKATDDLKKAIANQIPPTWTDRWNAWRYLAMLGNPKTHIRNIFGNGAFMPAVFLKDMIARQLENNSKWIDQSARMRTPKADLSKNSAYRTFAEGDWEVMKKIVSGEAGGNKWSDKNEIMQERHVFGEGTVLDKLEKLNGDLLGGEDVWFMRRYYIRALAEALQARGVSEEKVRNKEFGATETEAQILNECRQWASNEAQRNTYHDANAVAQTLNKLKRSGPVAGFLLEGLMPFTTTPANILRRGIEYSPIGLIQSIVQLNKDLRSSEFTTSQCIDRLAAGMSGTMIMVVGALLGALGVLRGAGPDDDEEAAFEKLQGHQNWSIELFGGSYTLDWMAPTALPLFTGVVFQEMLEGEGLFGVDPGKALSSLAEPLMSLSMLDGIESTLTSLSYAKDTNTVYTLLLSMTTSYLAQGFPTILGQAARSIDKDRRQTYNDPDKTGLISTLDKFVQNSIQAKTPIWENKKMAYVDEWGRTDSSESALDWIWKVAENFLSPGYGNIINETPVDAELTRLVEATGNTQILPDKLGKTFTAGKQDYKMTADEYEKANKINGQTYYAILNDIFLSDEYNELDDENKLKVIKEAKEYAASCARYGITDTYKRDNWHEIADKVGASTYIMMKSDIDDNKSKEKLFGLVVNNPELTTEQKAILMGTKFNAPSEVRSIADNAYVYQMTDEDEDAIAEIYQGLLDQALPDLFNDPNYINANQVEKGRLAQDLDTELKTQASTIYADILDKSDRVWEVGRASSLGKEAFGKVLDLYDGDVTAQAKYISDMYKGERTINNPSHPGYNMEVEDWQKRNLAEEFKPVWQDAYSDLLKSNEFKTAPSREYQDTLIASAYNKAISDFEDRKAAEWYTEGKFEGETLRKASSYKWDDAADIARTISDDPYKQAEWLMETWSADNHIDVPGKAGYVVNLNEAQKNERRGMLMTAGVNAYVAEFNKPGFSSLTKEQQDERLKGAVKDAVNIVNSNYATELIDRGTASMSVDSGMNRETFYQYIAESDMTEAEKMATFIEKYTGGTLTNWDAKDSRIDAYAAYVKANWPKNATPEQLEKLHSKAGTASGNVAKAPYNAKNLSSIPGYQYQYDPDKLMEGYEGAGSAPYTGSIIPPASKAAATETTTTTAAPRVVIPTNEEYLTRFGVIPKRAK